MRLKFILTLTLLFACAKYTFINAQTVLNQESPFSKIGISSGAFLTLPIGARTAGFGGGFVAIADDPNAIFSNPAGITQIPGIGASYSYSKYYGDITHNAGAFTMPVNSDYRIGVQFQSFGTSDIPYTDLFHQEGYGATFSARNNVLGLVFAGQITDQFSFGIGAKYVNLGFATVSANGVAFDLGTLYKPGIYGLRIGFAAQNLSSSFKYSGNGLLRNGTIDPITGNKRPDVQLEATESSLPLLFRAGISTNVLEGNADNSLLINLEFANASDKPENLTIGGEYTWNKLLSVRAGYLVGSSNSFGLSGGLGFNYVTGSFIGMLDYAARIHATLGVVHNITASIKL
jgi:long-subunit fatty acid transport protein